MFSIRESTMCFCRLWCDLMWFGRNAFLPCSVGLHSVLADYVVKVFSARSKKVGVFLGLGVNAHDWADERLSASGVK